MFTTITTHICVSCFSTVPLNPSSLIRFLSVPLMYFVLLWQHRKALQDQDILDREEATGYPELGHLHFLFHSYKPNFYYYEVSFRPIICFLVSCLLGASRALVLPFLLFQVIECMRRLSLASLIGIAAADSAVSPTLGLLICSAFQFG